MTTDETTDAIQRAAMRTPDVTHCLLHPNLFETLLRDPRSTHDIHRKATEWSAFGLPVVIDPRVTGWQIWADCPDCVLRVTDASEPINASERFYEYVTDERGRQRYVCAKCKGKRSVLVVSSE